MIVKKPDHTVVIDNFGCYAQGIKLEIPFRRRRYEDVKIQAGPTRKFGLGYDLRKMNFTGTLLGDIQEVRDDIERIQKRRTRFVSIYIGAFDALITVNEINYVDGSPGVTVANFIVEEVV